VEFKAYERQMIWLKNYMYRRRHLCRDARRNFAPHEQ